MNRKDKRSLLASLVLGDGSLPLRKYKRKDGTYGHLVSIAIGHGLPQEDYLLWKKGLLEQALDRPINAHYYTKPEVHIRAYDTKFRTWRKRMYPNGRKSIPEVLKLITDVDLCLTLWMLDDGWVQPAKRRNKGGELFVTNSSQLCLSLCDQTQSEIDYIINWFEQTFGPGIKVVKIWSSKSKKTNKRYCSIKFGSVCSRDLYKRMRPYIQQIPSMAHKFRHLEKAYQHHLLIAPGTSMR